MMTALLCVSSACVPWSHVSDVWTLSPDVSHVFPEFPAPDLGSMLLQGSVTLHDLKALQLVYRRHCEVTPYSARPSPSLQLHCAILDLCPTGGWSPVPHWTDLGDTASACSLLMSRPFGDLRRAHSCLEHQARGRAYP